MEALATATTAGTHLFRLRARVKALESGLDLLAVQLSAHEWHVPSISRDGLLHLVRRLPASGDFTCTCEAGSYGRACVHAQAIAALLERRDVRPRP